MLPIDIIATFNVLGDIKPNYVRLEDDNHALHTYKIEGIEYRKEDKRAGNTSLIFVCNIEVEGIKRQLELSYNLSSHKWVLL
jgi:hypothetical protein